MSEIENHNDHTYTDLCRRVSAAVWIDRGFLLDRGIENDDRFGEHGTRLLDRGLSGQGDVGDHVFHAPVVGKALEVRPYDPCSDPRRSHDPAADSRHRDAGRHLFFAA